MKYPELTLIEASLNQELSAVRCPFRVERWRVTELYLIHGEIIDIGFFDHSIIYLLSPAPVCYIFD
jgi:hypothetical protein